jgi:phosphoribosylformylglycinamidine synthase
LIDLLQQNAIAEALSNIVGHLSKMVWKDYHFGSGCGLVKNGRKTLVSRSGRKLFNFAIELGINIPTGRFAFDETKYPNEEVIAPGTVIISAGGNCIDINKVVEPVLQRDGGSIYYINLSQMILNGSSLAQTLNTIGKDAPTIKDAAFFKSLQYDARINFDNQILAGHDIGSGGLITTPLEMCFADLNLGAKIDFSCF